MKSLTKSACFKNDLEVVAQAFVDHQSHTFHLKREDLWNNICSINETARTFLTHIQYYETTHLTHAYAAPIPILTFALSMALLKRAWIGKGTLCLVSWGCCTGAWGNWGHWGHGESRRHVHQPSAPLSTTTWGRRWVWGAGSQYTAHTKKQTDTLNLPKSKHSKVSAHCLHGRQCGTHYWHSIILTCINHLPRQ